MSAISIPRNQPDPEDLGALAEFKLDPGVFVWAKTVGDPNVLAVFRPIPQMLVCSAPASGPRELGVVVVVLRRTERTA